MKLVKRVFMVDGKPFYPIGGQSRNSSGYNDKESETAFKAIKLLHGNTLQIPVYWDQIEPEEGKFDFTAVDALLASARQNGVKLIILWFATWKNGNMDYAPAWVKTDKQRFRRVISSAGKDIWVLSSHCQANLKADQKAFVTLCKHLKAKDSAEKTVIALQIENELGILGSDRDYGPEAQATFDSAVPLKLLAAMKTAGKGRVYDIWEKAGRKESGTWPQVFNWEAGELMTAWSGANYVNSIAESGKTAYDIPMYINVWVMEQGQGAIAGETYPSGGSVTKVLDIYKWFTPHIDLVGPDNYQDDSRSFESICASYSRDDNPFFMPETVGDQNMFRAIADYDSIAFVFFGVEHIVGEGGAVRTEYQTVVDNVRCTAAVTPLLLKHQGTGNIHSVIQEDLSIGQSLDLNGYSGIVQFGKGRTSRAGKDWRHSIGWATLREQTNPNRGRGLVIQASRNEFYLVGTNYRLFLRPEPTLDKVQGRLLAADDGYLVSVDEGHFERNNEFVADRRRNGDEINSGVWVEPDNGVVRVITCD
jgi:hypothetical protein